MSVIPMTTDAIPIITIFLTILMLLVGTSTIVTTIILKLYSSNLLHFDHGVPEYIWNFFCRINVVENDELLRKLEKALKEKDKLDQENCNLIKIGGDSIRNVTTDLSLHNVCSQNMNHNNDEEEPNRLLGDVRHRYKHGRTHYRKTIKHNITKMMSNTEENGDRYLEAMEHIEKRKIMMEIQFLQWKYIAMRCDRVCIYIYSSILIVSSAWFFSYYFTRGF